MLHSASDYSNSIPVLFLATQLQLDYRNFIQALIFNYLNPSQLLQLFFSPCDLQHKGFLTSQAVIKTSKLEAIDILTAFVLFSSF